MCGIAGILRVHPPGTPPPPPELAIPESWLDILDESIKHRGPDGQGRFRDRAVRADGSIVDVAFVHRRLSILDHAGGSQPMVSMGKSAATASAATFQGMPLPVIFHGKPNDEVRYRPLDATTTAGLVAVVFNGCIYNHRELRKELQAAGHVFESDHSDTEVLVHGWREWGKGTLIQDGQTPLRSGSVFSKLHDMFAVAVWDASDGSLTLARDRFGQKPLHFAVLPRQGASFFASDVPPLARLSLALGEPTTIETAVLGDWIRYGAALSPPIANIYAVAISTQVEVNGISAQTQWYEMPEFWSDFYEDPWGGIGTGRSGTLTPENVCRALDASVRQRLQADVAVGCFLSGGIDSSLLAQFAMQALGRLDTFSVRMPVDSLDETSFASIVAELLGTSHTILDCAPEPAMDLSKLITQMGLPFGDSSLLPTFWVSRSTRAAVTVAISGDGGDELFGGYERYTGVRVLERAWPLLALLPLSAGRGSRTRLSQVARLADAARHDQYNDLISLFPLSMARKLFLDRSTLGYSPFGWIGNGLGGGIEGAIRNDLNNYLPNDLLRKTDAASMSVALEVRCPFLSPLVAGPASHAKIKTLMPNGQRKGLLRAVARKYFPAEIVDRPKQGFAIPIGEWFRSDYGGTKQLLLDHLNSAEPWGSPSLGIDLNMKFVRQMLDEHMGTGMSGRVTRDHSQRLYMLLVLSIWAKWLSGLK